MELTPDILQTLGVSAVLAVFLYLAWGRLELKDKIIERQNDRLMEKYEENTRATTQQAQATLRQAEAIEKLTEVQETFLQRIDRELRDSSY